MDFDSQLRTLRNCLHEIGAERVTEFYEESSRSHIIDVRLRISDKTLQIWQLSGESKLNEISQFVQTVLDAKDHSIRNLAYDLRPRLKLDSGTRGSRKRRFGRFL